MKIEIEVSDDQIRTALEYAVKSAISQELGSWHLKEDVQSLVKERWPEVVGEMIEEEMRNRDALRATIVVEMQRKIRAQLTAALKEADK